VPRHRHGVHDGPAIQAGCCDLRMPEAGRQSIGGFLAHTDRFVICWTPRYFTRLWCTYEIAAWLSLGKPLSSVLFMPLVLAKQLAAATVWSMLLVSVYALMQMIVPWVAWILAILIILTWVPVLVHYEQVSLRSWQTLPTQLREFSIRDSKCFCCTHNHHHPVTGDAIRQCDRKLVNNTVSSWFRRSDEDVDVGLSQFDAYVRGPFRDSVLRTAQPTRMPYLYMVMTVSWPWLFRGFDSLVALSEETQRSAMRLLAEFLALVFLTVPISYRFHSFIVLWWDKEVGSPVRCCMRFASTLGLALLFTIVILALWVPMSHLNMLESVWPFTGIVIVKLLLLVVCFRVDASHLAFCISGGRLGQQRQGSEVEPAVWRIREAWPGSADSLAPGSAGTGSIPAAAACPSQAGARRYRCPPRGAWATPVLPTAPTSLAVR